VRTPTILAALVLASAVVAGCGSAASPSPSTAPSPSPTPATSEVCTAIADLQASVESIKDVRPVVAAVGTAMVDLRIEAKAAFTECAIDD
jgi:hypothetical protein